MVLQEYITVSDIDYSLLQRVVNVVNEDVLQSYVDKTNEFYEDLAQRIGIFNAEDLQFPVPYEAKEMLIYHATWKYTSKAKGLSKSSIGLDPYGEVAAEAKKDYQTSFKQMTKEYMSGTVTNNSQRGTMFGDLTRSM
jgi:hypothetical protein